MKPVFYDPQRKRWKRLRRLFDVVAVLSTIVLVLFFSGVLHMQSLSGLPFPDSRHNLHPYRQVNPRFRPSRRHLHRRPSDIVLNQDEGLRAAFYTNDEESYASFKAHIRQIDLLFPDWLHVVQPTGALQAIGPEYPQNFYDVVDKSGVHGIDWQNRVAHQLAITKAETEVIPMLNNYDALTGKWTGAVTAQVLADPAARRRLHLDLDKLLWANPRYRGICMDFESLPTPALKLYAEWLAAMHQDFLRKGLKLYVNIPAAASPAELRTMAASTDGVILMDYDEHEDSSAPGPVAGETWFESNLSRVLTYVPRQKILVAIGNYGYDWQQSIDDKGNLISKQIDGVDDISVQEAWDRASSADATVQLNGDELNPHFAYDDDDAHERHNVWFLDGVTALNELRAARQMGLRTFALWRLGTEDPSLWSIWAHPSDPDAPQQLESVPPGPGVDNQGEGDLLRITGTPVSGTRKIFLDSYKFTLTDELMTSLPHPYQLQYFGYKPGELALSFDDGPDPTWTPRILDVLEKYHVPATFMVIGEAAEDHVGLLQREYRDGFEIGNHTFTHPDISEISPRELDLELNLTERLFGAELGVQPHFFRPPYSIDQEPDTNDQATPAYRIQKMGYVIVGDKIDTNDWNEHPRKTPREITDSVLGQLDLMKDKGRGYFRGSIILMHDGGGNRSATVAALPLLIQTLRARGYKFVQVSALMGKTRAEVMPKLSPRQWWQARVDQAAFFLFSAVEHFVVFVFFVGDVLMSGRLLIIGVCALIDRLRSRKTPPGPFSPQIAVLVPAYNEETVIVRTVRSVLRSDYKPLRVIVIDDGSTDATVEVMRDAYRAEIAAGTVTVMTKPNAGKAEALNYALERLDEEFYVGIDADTVIAPDAISRLVCHFADLKIGAVAGNAKVGNRVNLWTRWQALEYITSQNFERRALDLFNVVTVVPGAIGAWRTDAVRLGGGYPINTVAEDADLTMSLLEQNYKVIYEDRALAYTEAPVTAGGLMRQRFRWSFGILQAVFKHKQAARTNRAMGLFALPNILVFQILLPLVSPFIDLMFLAGFTSYLWQRHFHPEAASAADFDKLLVYFSTFLIIDFVTSALAFSLERRHPNSRGDGLLLFHIVLQRFAYRQLFSLVLFKTLKRAVDGRPFNWDKLERTAKMSSQIDRITSPE
jgi:cellulose synthase/poly-beta-1,6-N-acetylglucosamine synthase-like glycosyltransferase/peptidoglycan/xylan/chitin deacetylase (PgdA/CDA1 family)/spore germination protein YaaH